MATRSGVGWPWLLAAGLALVLVPAAVRLSGGMYDAAYIHLRIAGNRVLHGAPEFNPGDPVYASSSTGWTLVLAAWTLIGGGSPAGITALSALASAGAAAIWAKVVSEQVPTGAGRVAAGVTALVVA